MLEQWTKFVPGWIGKQLNSWQQEMVITSNTPSLAQSHPIYSFQTEFICPKLGMICYWTIFKVQFIISWIVMGLAFPLNLNTIPLLVCGDHWSCGTAAVTNVGHSIGGGCSAISMALASGAFVAPQLQWKSATNFKPFGFELWTAYIADINRLRYRESVSY